VSLKCFDPLVRQLRQRMGALPDQRTGANTRYTMEDLGLAAFSVFFTQSPSFLAHQKAMQRSKGQNNAQALFQMEKIPTDNHVRDLLDPVPPEELFPVYDCVYTALWEQGLIETFQGVGHTQLIALDGAWYFSSEKIHCDHCSQIERQDGRRTYYHSAVTPVLVAPGHNQAIPLRPEFITPQDGQTKQDCEINASKRWLEKHGAFYQRGNTTLLGDDLYAHQPFCRRALLYGYHFIFVCKPDSHPYLYRWIERLEPGRDLLTLTQRVKDKNHWETHTYRYAHAAPLVEGADALKVNGCEVTITDPKGQVRYQNAFITDWKITADHVASIVASGRARWKIENENNNTLKTKGYHLEHNFGHGRQQLSSLLAAMNILAFLCHSFLSFCDTNYRLIRATLPTRKTFFQDIRALLRYLYFPSWEALLDFMMRGLEIGPYENQPRPVSFSSQA
jgi:hypothetical protein